MGAYVIRLWLPVFLGNIDMPDAELLEGRPAEEQPIALCCCRRALKQMNNVNTIKLPKTTFKKMKKGNTL